MSKKNPIQWWATLIAYRGDGSALPTITPSPPMWGMPGLIRAAGPFEDTEMAQFFGRMLLHHWVKEQTEDGTTQTEVQQVEQKATTPVKSARVKKG